MTFPKSVGQIPFAFPFKPGSDSPGFVRVAGALYPFGHGLSYTTFEYSDIAVDKPRATVGDSINVSFTVTNTGKVAGDEVAQLYLKDEISSLTTYERVLRGFERISLAPGESRRLTMTLSPRDLGLYDRDGNFGVEPGWFTVMVGRSSKDTRLETRFEVMDYLK